jgi:hypothetical protein
VGHGQDLGALEQIAESRREADQIEVCDLGLTAEDENEVLPERCLDRLERIVAEIRLRTPAGGDCTRRSISDCRTRTPPTLAFSPLIREYSDRLL